MERGCVVVSSAGKDKGSIMAVMQAAPGALWVADGRKRPVQQPKRKNPRHVVLLGCRVEEASMATNRELRRALAPLREQRNGRDEMAGDRRETGDRCT